MRKMSERRASLLIAAAVLLGGLTVGLLLSPEEGYSFPEPLKTVDVGTTDLSDKAIVADESFLPFDHAAGRTNFRDRRIVVDASFTSNLPLIVIDTDGVRPPAYQIWNEELSCLLPKEGVDPYITGTVAVLDNKNGTNALTDDPVLNSAIYLKRRGNSSTNYDKHQYLLKLIDSEGHANRLDVLGMGADDKWVLNGSFIDKSQLRNYLAYSLAGEIMPYTPDMRFCEVLWEKDGVYEYEGLYLIIESVSVGKNRVDLPAFSENSTHLPFLIRRDRYNPNGRLLDNYAARNNLLYGFLDVEWPNETVLSDHSVQRITDRIDAFESTLFSEDYEIFRHYRDFINEASFIDYLILNEFLINYDAGRNSTYVYSDYSGALSMGPIWDFDGAFDNYHKESANLQSGAFFQAPWFQQILRDPEFTTRVMERYQELRQSILSDTSIQSFIDDTVAGLGSAIDRDWARWGYFYREGNYLEPEYPSQPNRNTKTYEEEIEKIKTVLSKHGAWMDGHLDSLYQFVDPNAPQTLAEPEREANWGSLWAVVFVAAFFVSITLIQRLERGD